MTPPRQIRQGELLLVRIDIMPANAQPIAEPLRSITGQLVLSQGETTLHEHTISDAELLHAGRDILLQLAAEQPLLVTATDTGETLSRHNPVIVPPGMYRVIRQRVIDPSAAVRGLQWRQVID